MGDSVTGVNIQHKNSIEAMSPRTEGGIKVRISDHSRCSNLRGSLVQRIPIRSIQCFRPYLR